MRGRLKKSFEGCVMETRGIQLRTHQKKVDRYQWLLKTKLSESERQYLKKRISEETLAMLQLMEHQIKIKRENLEHRSNEGI
jgi:hypothetical protein